MLFSKWDAILVDPDRVNRLCLMHDTRLFISQIYVTMTELNRCKYKTCNVTCDVQTGKENIDVKSKDQIPVAS